MTTAPRRGLSGLTDLLSDEVVRRGTGAFDLGGKAAVYLVFGHPLHAVIDDATGVAALKAIRVLLLQEPGLEVTWLSGRTAGKAHSLSPSEPVLDILRGGRLDHYGPDGDAAGAGDELVGDLHLRRLIADAPNDAPAAGLVAIGARGPVAIDVPTTAPTPDPGWADVVSQVCARIEATLHLHARVLTEVIQAAPPDRDAILLAIERARSIPVRAVSRTVVAGLLRDAEDLVNEHTSPA